MNVSANLRRNALGRFGIAPAEGHGGPFLGEAFGAGAAYAARTTGDKHYLACESRHVISTLGCRSLPLAAIVPESGACT
jgi:hypothetical protein